jgi:hypothetical protein
MMMKRVFAKLLLVLLLLAGQQSALVHSVWHIQDRLPAQEQHDHAGAAQENGDEHSSQSGLCDLHGVLGALLAGDCGGQPAVVAFPRSSRVLLSRIRSRQPDRR